MSEMPGQRDVGRAAAAVTRDDAGRGWRFVVLVNGVRSAPSSDVYATEAAAWAAASRLGLQTPQV